MIGYVLKWAWYSLSQFRLRAWVGQFSIFGGSAPKKENGIFEFCSFQVTVFLFEFIVKRFIVKIYVVL